MSPYLRVRWPRPPPSVSPPTPVVEMIPLGVASPCSSVAASTSPQVQPPPTRTVRACGSTSISLQRREVDDDAVVAGAEAGAVVAAAADGEQQVVLARRSGPPWRHRRRRRSARSAPGACRSSRCRPCAPRRSRRRRGRSAAVEPRQSSRAALRRVFDRAHAFSFESLGLNALLRRPKARGARCHDLDLTHFSGAIAGRRSCADGQI